MKTPTTKEPSSMEERFREKFQSTPTSEKTFKERERFKEMIEGMKNKEFETREHGLSKGGVNIGSAQYSQALQDLLNKLDS